MSAVHEFGPVEKMRHSAAHVFAAAIAKLFPEAKFGVGPVIENGFYYDVLLSRALSTDDFEAIEKEMRKIIGAKLPMQREEMPLEEAIKFFQNLKQDFKVELLNDLKTKGTTAVNEDEAMDVDTAKPDTISIYRTGEFVDLCRGPHVENTKDIGAFELDRLSAAYWRGSEKNPQLQRVYGLCFATKDELKAYKQQREEAKKRDHRKLGKELELFTVIDEVGAGLPLFYPKGALLRRTVENFIIDMQEKRGYVPIWIPHITKGKLYEISGHLQKYDAMYPPMNLEGEDAYYMKPMNCPHFMMLYKTLPHSYRELPIRYTCTTTNYRYEKSGELSGLTRVRSLTQDDCHVFCMPNQIEGEINLMLDMISETYQAFQFTDFWVRISTHDPKNREKYIGGPEIWEESEAALARLIEKRGWKHKVGVGEAAFYGPKLDFMVKDVLGREWQLSTIQLDVNLPQRFELEYTDAQGGKARPVVIHRAILGSTERFLGILIEHFGGVFPTWLAPLQIKVIAVGEAHKAFAQGLAQEFMNAGIRAEADVSDDTVGKKIRHAEGEKVPYMLVVGDNEMQSDKLAVRRRGERETKEWSKNEFIAAVQKEIAEKK